MWTFSGGVSELYHSELGDGSFFTAFVGDPESCGVEKDGNSVCQVVCQIDGSNKLFFQHLELPHVVTTVFFEHLKITSCTSWWFWKANTSSWHPGPRCMSKQQAWEKVYSSTQACEKEWRPRSRLGRFAFCSVMNWNYRSFANCGRCDDIIGNVRFMNLYEFTNINLYNTLMSKSEWYIIITLPIEVRCFSIIPAPGSLDQRQFRSKVPHFPSSKRTHL